MDAASEIERIDHRKYVGSHAVPVEVEAIGNDAVAMAPQVDGDAAVGIGEGGADRIPHPGVKACGVTKHQGWSVAPQVMGGDGDPIGARDHLGFGDVHLGEPAPVWSGTRTRDRIDCDDAGWTSLKLVVRPAGEYR